MSVNCELCTDVIKTQIIYTMAAPHRFEFDSTGTESLLHSFILWSSWAILWWEMEMSWKILFTQFKDGVQSLASSGGENADFNSTPDNIHLARICPKPLCRTV